MSKFQAFNNAEYITTWLTCGEPARPSRSTPSARPDGEESLLLAPHTLATAAPSRNPLAQRLLAVLRPIRLTCGWGRTNFNALIVLQCSKTLNHNAARLLITQAAPGRALEYPALRVKGPARRALEDV